MPSAPQRSNMLNREQTEEWKGWMQILFLLYHYFNGKEIYNSIRIFIACYVWLTGFGHTSFCFAKKEYTIIRVVKMLLRLNFLVTFLCMMMKNEWMLYYICALHALWFIITYGTMAIFHQYNNHRSLFLFKIGILTLVCFFLWDFKIFMEYFGLVKDKTQVVDIFDIVWRPFLFLLHDAKGSLYEFQFRTYLDHYVGIAGILCAYFYPNYEALVLFFERERSKREEWTFKGLLALSLVVVCGIWAYYILLIPDRFSYNNYHPYTSFVPIFAFIILRNITPWLRKYHVQSLAWMGRITLETYLVQFHIFLGRNTRALVQYLPDNYPAMNLLVVSVVFVLVSYLLFNITGVLSDALIPYTSTNWQMLSRSGWVLAAGAAFCGVGLLVQTLIPSVALFSFVFALLALIPFYALIHHFAKPK